VVGKDAHAPNRQTASKEAKTRTQLLYMRAGKKAKVKEHRDRSLDLAGEITALLSSCSR
jgi:hypothetical protein